MIDLFGRRSRAELDRIGGEYRAVLCGMGEANTRLADQLAEAHIRIGDVQRANGREMAEQLRWLSPAGNLN